MFFSESMKFYCLQFIAFLSGAKPEVQLMMPGCYGFVAMQSTLFQNEHQTTGNTDKYG